MATCPWWGECPGLTPSTGRRFAKHSNRALTAGHFSSDAMTQPPLSIWHPFTQQALDPVPIAIERAQGVYLYTADGRTLIDAISSWWVNLHGHAHPGIARAIGEQARRLEHVIFAGFTHQPAEELAGRLRSVLPSSMRHIFFSDDGSTAVEVGLKMALQYWRNTGPSGKT